MVKFKVKDDAETVKMAYKQKAVEPEAPRLS